MYKQADAIIQIFNHAKVYTACDFFDTLNIYLKQRYQVTTANTEHHVQAIIHGAATLSTLHFAASTIVEQLHRRN